MELKFLAFLNLPPVIWVLETRIISWFLGLFLPWLEMNDLLPADTGVVRNIFLITYAATPKGLTRMSQNTTELAAELARRCTQATIYFCQFGKNQPGSREISSKFRLLPNDRLSCAGIATSTTDEREILVQCAGGDVKESILVGNGAHIRRAATVWEHYHPYSKLYFRCTHAKSDDDITNPMTAQRRWQTWVVANLAGLLAFKVFGVEHYAKKNFSQPVD